LETVARVMLEYCPDIQIILRSRLRPDDSSFPGQALMALDEADLRTYLESQQRVSLGRLTNDSVRLLFKITDGVPSRIDSSLKELEVVNLVDLASGSTDFSRPSDAPANVPATLQSAVEELSTSSDKARKRTFDLLRVLSAFPQGVEFDLIRRFRGVNPFYAEDAVQLKARALILVSETPSIKPVSELETPRLLAVPRPVRDYVRDQMTGEDLTSLNRRAAELFFGPDWRTGSKRWAVGRNYSKAQCGGAEIANASAILIRLTKVSLVTVDDDEVMILAGLAASYCNSLVEGDHFQSVVTFAEEFLPLLVEFDKAPAPIAVVKYQYGACLRMIGRRPESLQVLQGVKVEQLTQSNQQGLLLDIAMNYAQDDDDRGIEYAKRAIAIDKNAPFAIQAQTVLIQLPRSSMKRTS
jgi:hypothetical protein